jgi:hypothetical protein
MSDYAACAPDFRAGYERTEPWPATELAVYDYAQPLAYQAACREALRRVRRDVWDARESRLRAKWESYG